LKTNGKFQFCYLILTVTWFDLIWDLVVFVESSCIDSKKYRVWMHFSLNFSFLTLTWFKLRWYLYKLVLLCYGWIWFMLIWIWIKLLISLWFIRSNMKASKADPGGGIRLLIAAAWLFLVLIPNPHQDYRIQSAIQLFLMFFFCGSFVSCNHSFEIRPGGQPGLMIGHGFNPGQPKKKLTWQRKIFLRAEPP